MTREDRAAILRARHRALFPQKVYQPVIRRPKTIEKRGPTTTIPFGEMLWDPLKEWVRTPDERTSEELVPKHKRRQGESPLTAISEKLRRPEKVRENVPLTPTMDTQGDLPEEYPLKLTYRI